MPAGYQTLTVQLLDNGVAVMGAVEVVRIVAGQMTSGTYAFTNVNQPGGAVQVNITPAMAEPIAVSMCGVPSTVSVGANVTATASVDDGTTGAVYVWYFNGAGVGTGASYTLGSAERAGWYRLDVTAFSADGTRAGSATATFRVTGQDRLFLYTVNADDDTLSAFSVGPTGQLAPLSNPTFSVGRSPAALAVTPDRSFLYVTDSNGADLSEYAIGSDGLLTPLRVPRVATGICPFGIAVTPNGSFLFVTNRADNSVSGFAIGSDGRLTTRGTAAAGKNPFGIRITPDGSFLYVANRSDNTVSAYAIGPGGVLTPLSAPSVAAGDDATGLIATPDGSVLYGRESCEQCRVCLHHCPRYGGGAVGRDRGPAVAGFQAPEISERLSPSHRGQQGR